MLGSTPKLLLVMFDGVRADAVNYAEMPVLQRLRAGTWQPGYFAAYTDAGQSTPDAVTHSAPNHVSIVTGVNAAKHKVSANGETGSGNYREYPHLLGRIAGKYPEYKCGYFYVWGESGTIGCGCDRVIYQQADDAANIANATAFLRDGDAAVVYVDLPDHIGHKFGYYPYSPEYLDVLRQCDIWLGEMLETVCCRPGFANENWLILLTADHGGYHQTHNCPAGNGMTGTVWQVVCGRNVVAGELPGITYTCDMAATALAHFAVSGGAELDGKVLNGSGDAGQADEFTLGLDVDVPEKIPAGEILASIPGMAIVSCVNGEGVSGVMLRFSDGIREREIGQFDLTNGKNFIVLVRTRDNKLYFYHRGADGYLYHMAADAGKIRRYEFEQWQISGYVGKKSYYLRALSRIELTQMK